MHLSMPTLSVLQPELATSDVIPVLDELELTADDVARYKHCCRGRDVVTPTYLHDLGLSGEAIVDIRLAMRPEVRRRMVCSIASPHWSNLFQQCEYTVLVRLLGVVWLKRQHISVACPPPTSL